VKIAFTIATISYLPRAFVLASGFLKYNPDYKFLVFLLDPYDEHVNAFLHERVTCIPIADIDNNLLNTLSGKLSVSEISFTLKSILSLHVIQKYPEAACYIYLDADIAFYQSLLHAETLLRENDFLLTPHFTHPIKDDHIPTELDILRTGLYNMGFAAFKNTENVKNLLQWWKERVMLFGKENHDLGLSADQMWMSLTPLLFKNIGIIRNPGYNFAYWNIHERSISFKNEIPMVNESYPLVFVHFADFDPEKPENFTNPKHFSRQKITGNNALKQICRDYATELLNSNYHACSQIRSRYATSSRWRAWRQLKKSTSLRDFIKFLSVFLFSLIPTVMKIFLRKFSLFILRNVK